MSDKITLPKEVLSLDGTEIGKTTGIYFHCRLEGCNGVRIAVRWPDGKITYPCSRGLLYTTPEQWRIG